MHRRGTSFVKRNNGIADAERQTSTFTETALVGSFTRTTYKSKLHADPAGHAAEHYVLVDSWLPRQPLYTEATTEGRSSAGGAAKEGDERATDDAERPTCKRRKRVRSRKLREDETDEEPTAQEALHTFLAMYYLFLGAPYGSHSRVFF